MSDKVSIAAPPIEEQGSVPAPPRHVSSVQLQSLAGAELATSAAKSIMARVHASSESDLVRRILSVDDYIVAVALSEHAAAIEAPIEAPIPDTSAIVPAVVIPVPGGIAQLLDGASKTSAVALKSIEPIARPAPQRSADHATAIQHLLTVATGAATLSQDTAQRSDPASIKTEIALEPATEPAPAPPRPTVPDQPNRTPPPPALAHSKPAIIEKPLIRTESIFHLPRKLEVAEPWPSRLLRYVGYAVAGYAATMLALLVIFRFIDPPGSALMAWRWINGTTVTRDWVPISSISPNLVRAVIVSEDWTFCAHHGVDVAAMQEAIEKAGDGIPRGASTISMQVVKNVFLWPSKSYIRKAIELPMTLVMEILWPKQRVLEVYLNVAEWGPGVFGAEAAARHHFNKPASKLTSREAAQLAASLPNPFIRDAGDPGPRLARKATTIQNRMRIAGGVTDCVGVASDAKAP